MSSTRIPATDALLTAYRGPVLVGITPAILLGPHPDGGWRVWAEVFGGVMRVRTESVALDVAGVQARDFVVGRLAVVAVVEGFPLDLLTGVAWTADSGCCEVRLSDGRSGSASLRGPEDGPTELPWEVLAAVAREVLR